MPDYSDPITSTPSAPEPIPFHPLQESPAPALDLESLMASLPQEPEPEPPQTPPLTADELPQEAKETSKPTPPPPSDIPSNVPTLVSPPHRPKVNRKFIFAGIAAFLIIVLLPLGMFLVNQRQNIGKKAAVGDCWGECHDGQEVEVCCTGSDEEGTCYSWDSHDTGNTCGDGGGDQGGEPTQEPAPPDTLINACDHQDCDTANFSPGHLICIEQWQRPDGSVYEKVGADTGEICGDSDTLLNECIRQDCDTVNFPDPGHLVCIEQWQKPDGSTYEKPGSDTGNACTTRSALQVCQDFGGGETTTCSADPNCGGNGGSCCDKDGTNYCCYGDSQTRRDGACYVGLQNRVVCSGNTITNNTQNTITLNSFSGPGTTCPFSSPDGQQTLGPGESAQASCSQLDAPGFCGVCDDSNCGGGGGQGGETTTAQCTAIFAYDTNWVRLDASALAALTAGATLRLTVTGQTSSGDFDKARFSVNGTMLPETTAKKPNSSEFFTEYIIPQGTTTFNVEAEVHHPTLGWR